MDHQTVSTVNETGTPSRRRKFNDASSKGQARVSMRELYGRGEVVLSFEVFPPKTPQGFDALYRNVGELAEYKPGFISITYGAGGSTQSQSLDIITQIRERYKLDTTAHFTLVGSTVDGIHEFLKKAKAVGTNNIMALRGDPPQGQEKFKPVTGGLSHANELVALIKNHYPEFGIGVAGYPETHIEATSPQDDLAHLATKVAAGADAVYTQLFYDNADFLRFRDACEQRGIGRPIIPGLLPIISLAQIKRITSLCGSKLPQELFNQLEKCGDNAPAQTQVGIEHCAKQCENLLREGIPGIHFYVLNRADTIKQILGSVFPATKR